jgi:hypothetical protein
MRPARNSGFCWPSIVHSYYVAINVSGRYDGNLFGSAGNVGRGGNNGCAPLYDHSQLVRVTG